MKKFLSISLLIIGSLYGEPYKPEPILWIHGFTGSSKDWGVKMHKLPPVDPRPDTIIKDSVILDHTFGTFLNKMLPYAETWYQIDHSYTFSDTQLAYPNKSFLEIINFQDPMGSLDPDERNYPDPFKGWGDELVHRIKSVLKEYYGPNWKNNPEAKVVLISHSQGGLAIREALKEDPSLIPHIQKIITLNTPHLGTIIANLGMRDLMIITLFLWHPLAHPLGAWVGGLIRTIGSKISLVDWFANSIKIDLQNHCIRIGDKLILNLEGDKIATTIIENIPSQFFDIPYLGELLTAFAFFEGIGAPIVDMLPGLNITYGSIPDLAEGSTFIRNLGTYGAGKIPFVCVMSRGFYDDDKYKINAKIGNISVSFKWSDVRELNRNIGLPLTASYWALSFWIPKPFLEWAIKSSASEMLWEWWNADSDFWVRWGSQSVNQVSSDFNSKEIKEWGMYHGRITKEPNIILKALEERPLIDSVMLIQTFTDSYGNTRFDTTFLSENKIDTIVTSFQNLRIEGKLKGTYFLHISAPYIYVNGVQAPKLKYPENCGYEGRKFFVDSTYLRLLGAGYNTLSISSKNAIGEISKRNYTLWLVPSGWFCMQENPDYRKVLSKLNENDTFKIRLIKLGLSDSLQIIDWDTLKVNFVKLIKDTNGWFIPDPKDNEYLI